MPDLPRFVDPAPTGGRRLDFAEWAALALPDGHVPAAHHRLLMAALSEIDAGTRDRLMILMPPGSAKSTYASRLFPPWWFAGRPGSDVIACSHTASLAGHFGQDVRELIAEHATALGCEIGKRRSRNDFRTAAGGSYFAVGVMGAVTGRRADLILIDDPVRGHLEAWNPRARERLWDWYRSDLLTRLKPRGRIVLIMTRWHDDDLGGRLLAADDGWHCLRLPAFAEEGDPLGRDLGAPLWPEWEDAAALERKRALLGDRVWASLYQQMPRPPHGQIFAASRIETVETASPTHCVRGWDLAATGEHERRDSDWTVGVKLGRDGNRFVVMDVIRLRGTWHEVERAIVRAAVADGVETTVSLPQDPGQAGKQQAHYLVASLAGYRVHTSAETGSKKLRAAPVACQVEAGNVAIVRAPWNRSFLDELIEFPDTQRDDQVDALARAFNQLCALPGMARRTQLPLLTR